MSNAVVPYGQIESMAEAFSKSGMFGAKTKEQALSLLLLAQAEGVHPAIAMRDFHVIQGRPAKKADAMHRSFLEAGGKIEWHELTDKLADATFSHPQGGSARITWDMARVEAAKIQNADMYKKYPRQMLKARCVSEGCRTVYPAATSGMYVAEEIQGFAKEKDMGPAPIVEDELVTPDQAVAIEDAFKANAVALAKKDRTQEKLLRNVSKQYGRPITMLGQIKAQDFDDAMSYASGS